MVRILKKDVVGRLRSLGFTSANATGSDIIDAYLDLRDEAGAKIYENRWGEVSSGVMPNDAYQNKIVELLKVDETKQNP